MATLPVYLVDFSCFNAPEELRVDYQESQAAAWRWKVIHYLGGNRTQSQLYER